MRNKVIIQVAFLLLSISGFARISPSISAVSKQSSGILFTQTDNSTFYLPCQSVSAIVQSGGSSNTITVYYANEQSSIKTLAFDYTVTGFSTKQQAVDSLYEWSSCDTSGGGGGSGTVTSIATDATMTGSPITTSGTLKVDTTRISTKANVVGLTQGKQDALVSGTNIKTVNSTTLLGSGNLPVNVGVVYRADSIRLYVIGGTDTIVFGYAVRGLAYASDTLSWYVGNTRTANYIGGGGGSGSLSSLTAATATNNIFNTNYKQRWNWNTIAGDTAMVIASSSTGAASNLQNVLTVANSGVNATSSQTTFGLKVSNLKTGTTSTNIGAYFEALNGATNYAVDVLGDLRMNNYSNIRMGLSSQIYMTNGSGINFNSTTQGIRYNNVGYMDYFAGASYHIFTSTKTLPFVIAATSSTNYLSFAKPSTDQNSIIFNGDFSSGSYRGETTYSNTINAANGIFKIAANTGQAGGYAAFTPNYVLSVKPTTCINLTPITATAASAITAAEGDLLFVSDTNGTFTSIGLWCYENGAWSKK